MTASHMKKMSQRALLASLLLGALAQAHAVTRDEVITWIVTPGPAVPPDAGRVLTQADMERVNESILSHARSHVELIPEIANHLINSGGKRIRPMLTLAAARMCGYDGEHHLKLATAVEFMHTATLLHDDVVDESDMRRGRPAARPRGSRRSDS